MSKRKPRGGASTAKRPDRTDHPPPTRRTPQLTQALTEMAVGAVLVILGGILAAVLDLTFTNRAILFGALFAVGVAALVHGYLIAGPAPARALEPEVKPPVTSGPIIYKWLVTGCVLVVIGFVLGVLQAGQPFREALKYGTSAFTVAGVGVFLIYAGMIRNSSDRWERAGDVIAAKGALPAMVAVTFLMAWVYLRVFHGEPVGDDLTFHYAESARIAECLRAGDWDLWNPSANAGYASAYYYQVIPQLASAVPAALFGHLLFWFELSIFLPLVLAPAAAYRGLRLLGATPWQSVVGGIAIGFCIGASRWGEGSDGTFTIGLYTQTWALAVFPLALGYGARWLRDGVGLASAIAWATFSGLCHPFAGVCLAVALMAGVIARVAFTLEIWRSKYATGVVLLHLGLPLAPIAYLILPADPLGFAIGAILAGAILAAPVLIVLGWRQRADFPDALAVTRELLRLDLLGAVLIIATVPGWITLLVDYVGFGGFPHRVNDEVGPGLLGLLVGTKNLTAVESWFPYGWFNMDAKPPLFVGYLEGGLFDANRPAVITVLLPIALIFGRGSFRRWLWGPALAYVVLLALGPHLKTGQDDLIPAVRFLGALQVVLAIGVGATMVEIATRIWRFAPGTFADRLQWILTRGREQARVSTENGVRTVIAAIGAALIVLTTLRGANVLQDRVKVSTDYGPTHRNEMQQIIDKLPSLGEGRKQAGPGAENHWWNLLPYVYADRPALLQMGGGGLQASPNYDFLWTSRDFTKNAWLYDAPIITMSRAADKKKQAPEGTTVFETRNFEIRTLPSPGLVSPVEVTGVLPPGRVPARQAALEWVRTDAPLHDQMLAYDGSGPPGGPPAGKVIQSRFQSSPGDDPDIVADVDDTAPTTFVARESWHPRWHAYVDGVETPTRRLTPDFVAADVPAGKHQLTFRFQRPWWAWGSWLLWPLTCIACWLLTRLYTRLTTPQLPRARVVVHDSAVS